ncbi:MAG: DUF1015 family protein [Ignavibacterium sp.]|nr:DUF1015 family protein [Ignavibacterium sp.]MCX7611140.1 DUF1015 family protein [Ignavibacterium sp.]MDW8375995.1 DUF1015 family protein [Ignavibacteriales bacterium]
MAVIRPFKALRPTKENAHLVASVPYDVINVEEAKELAKDNPLSFLHVTRSEIDLPENIDVYSNEVYQKAKENLDNLINNAPLVLDEEPHFYLYRLIMNGRAQTGIAATFSVDDYDNDVILKHEKTRKVKEDDRTNHIITTNAQTGVVFLTYRGVQSINEIVDHTIQTLQPEYDFIAPDGIQHTIWILPDEYNQTIISEFEKINKLYIADGHHRAKSASRAREEKMKSNPNHKGDEEYNYFIAVIFPAEQLQILPYNRVVFDLNGLSKEDFLNAISEKFEVSLTEQKEPKNQKEFCMYLDHQWYNLKARDSVLASLSLEKSVGEKLDVSILQNFLLNPVLGIDDPRTSNRIDFIGGIRGTKELEKLVDSGKAAVAFSLYPVSLDDLMNISDAGEIMPPKSTWFEPKLRDGLLTHLI